jgi:rubrerythrin
MATTGNWVVKLQCYNCRSTFTLRRIPGTTIASVAASSTCPSCGATTTDHSFGTPRKHLLIEIIPETPTDKT